MDNEIIVHKPTIPDLKNDQLFTIDDKYLSFRPDPENETTHPSVPFKAWYIYYKSIWKYGLYTRGILLGLSGLVRALVQCIRLSLENIFISTSDLSKYINLFINCLFSVPSLAAYIAKIPFEFIVFVFEKIGKDYDKIENKTPNEILNENRIVPVAVVPQIQNNPHQEDLKRIPNNDVNELKQIGEKIGLKETFEQIFLVDDNTKFLMLPPIGKYIKLVWDNEELSVEPKKQLIAKILLHKNLPTEENLQNLNNENFNQLKFEVGKTDDKQTPLHLVSQLFNEGLWQEIALFIQKNLIPVLEGQTLQKKGGDFKDYYLNGFESRCPLHENAIQKELGGEVEIEENKINAGELNPEVIEIQPRSNKNQSKRKKDQNQSPPRSMINLPEEQAQQGIMDPDNNNNQSFQELIAGQKNNEINVQSLE